MRIAILLAVILCLTPSVQSVQDDDQRLDNWHQFRGPTGNGTAPNADPPTKWSEEKNVKWKVEIPGRGSSTPIVWKNKVFILTSIKTGKDGEVKEAEGRQMFPQPKKIYEFVVLCLDRKNGKVLWKKTANEELPHEGIHPDSTYASPSPTTDGEYLYVSFGSRGVYCYDLEGELQWKRDFGDMKILRQFGEGTSPVVHGDSVVVLWDHEGQSWLYCLDRKTGKDKWKVKRNEMTTWQTPLIIEHSGKTQVLVNGIRKSISYDLETGKEIWKCGRMSSNPIPTPVADNGIVYFMTGFQRYAINAVKLSSKGDVTGGDEVVWSSKDAAPYVASPCLYDGILYVTKFSRGLLSAIDAKTGEVYYKPERLTGIRSIYASISAAKGKLYITGRRGTTLVVKHGKKFEILATNKLDDPIDASPVLVGREIFLRGKKHLYCISKRKEYR